MIAYAGRTIRQRREEGSQNESTCAFKQSAVNGEEDSDKGEESLKDLELYVDTFSCEMQPEVFVVWMMAGMAERRARR